ncbi:MAG: TIGR03862 family flavoprotein [Moraxellaceae bacterium]|nr:TIGR03862 family flavoprotein [Moraxellaceae bacterium]
MSANPALMRCRVAIVGGGPAGLMAAETLAAAGIAADVFDAMPSVGRKFLLAGIGGLNITHAEPFEPFMARYREREPVLRPLLAAFGADALREWVHGLGITTFVGSSQRVFPAEMKAAPLLRAWLHRLREHGVRFHTRHRFEGWGEEGALRFHTPAGVQDYAADAVVLAMGGASWGRLGSDGAWAPWLAGQGVDVAPLRPANCGFEVAGWSPFLVERFAGAPLKPVRLSFTDAQGHVQTREGEAVLTAQGIEGSLVYALSAPLRDTLLAQGAVHVVLDLAPGRTEAALAAALALPRQKVSLASHLRKRAGIDGVKTALLHECAPDALAAPETLARAIKHLPVTLVATRPLDEAISSAGGVRFEALDAGLMVQALPGVFCAGEMLDWEAPTGGYLLTACFASGRAAGQGAVAWLQARE